MKWNEFFKDIAAGNFRQAYLFTGPEEYVKREALEKLRAAILPVVWRRSTRLSWRT